MSLLEQIVEDARRSNAVRRAHRSVREVWAAADRAAPPRSLRAALEAAERTALIAEFKRRSPSAGVLGDHTGPAERARAYSAGGAHAISVLTDEQHFGGSLADISAVRVLCALPLLRKDFLLDEWDVVESRAAGADAVLLIARILDQPLLEQLLACARDVGMDALVEVHSAHELERALAAGARTIGINNRDLATLDESLEPTRTLAPLVPADVVLVSESAISDPDDVRAVRSAGAHAVLVGTALMRAGDPEALVRELVAA